MQRGQRHSVASFPYPANSDAKNPNALELIRPRRESVACTGATVKLHERFSSSEDKESSRRISVAYKPFLQAKKSTSRRNSPSSETRSQESSRYGNTLQEESPYASNLSLADQYNSNLSLNYRDNTKGTKIVFPQSTKLPQLNLSGPQTKPEKNKKKRRKKKAAEKDVGSKLPSIMVQDEGVVTLQVPAKVIKNGNTEDDGIDLKYKLEAKYFKMGWDTTKAFTYSYFPY